jgi:hypothetical protein
MVPVISVVDTIMILANHSIVVVFVVWFIITLIVTFMIIFVIC